MTTKRAFFRLNKRINKNLFLRFEEFVFKNSGADEIYLVMDSRGGELAYAGKIINLMNSSGKKFLGLAVGKVSSAAIPIFLSTHARYCYGDAYALIHRARRDKDADISDEDLFAFEKQILEFIALKLRVSLEDVYEMADNNTVINMKHALGKRFFFSTTNPIP